MHKNIQFMCGWLCKRQVSEAKQRKSVEKHFEWKQWKIQLCEKTLNSQPDKSICVHSCVWSDSDGIFLMWQWQSVISVLENNNTVKTLIKFNLKRVDNNVSILIQ